MDPRFNSWQGWFQTQAVALERINCHTGQAEEQWLASWATAQPRHNHLHCRALRWVGRNLVRWGSRLQQRYDVAGTIPTFYPAKSTR